VPCVLKLTFLPPEVLRAAGSQDGRRCAIRIERGSECRQGAKRHLSLVVVKSICVDDGRINTPEISSELTFSVAPRVTIGMT
jgi:hypothetical protein